MIVVQRYRMYRRSGHGAFAAAILAPPFLLLIAATVVVGTMLGLVL